MALSGPSWLVFLFSHLAVRLSQSRSTGAMTVWHPIIPLGLIVLLHAPCSSFKLITKSKMHSEHSVPCVVFLREDRGRERRQKWISVFGGGQSITKIFSLFSASLVSHHPETSTESHSVSEAWFTFKSTSEINMKAPTESNNHSHSCSDQ